ncbi:hypothetical protein BH10CYA1_BH10CYA1_03980 [soil metagenome]
MLVPKGKSEGDSIMATLNMQLSEPPPAMPEELSVPNWLELE